MPGDGLGCGSVVEGLCSLFETLESILNTAYSTWHILFFKKSGKYSKSRKYFLNDYQIHMLLIAT